MPSPDLIVQLIDDYGLDIDDAKEVAEFMEEHDIDDPQDGVEALGK